MSAENEHLKILLLYAMQDEADPLIMALGLERRETCWHPLRVFSGNDCEGHSIVLMSSGVDESYSVDNVATQNAAVMAALGIKKYQPNIVINAGTAGGFKTCDAKIGEVFLGTDFVYHDRRIPLPGFSGYGIGGFKFCPPSDLSREFRTAVVTTGNSLDVTPAERKLMIKLAKKYAVIKEMEAAAIAEMCYQARLPLIAIKSVTDLVDGDCCSQTEFIQNLKLASQRLQGAVSYVLRHITRQMVSQITQLRSRELVEKILALSAEE